MAEGGGPGLGADLFAKGIGQQKQAGGDDGTNSEDMLQSLAKAGGEKVASTAAKLGATFGVNLSSVGSVSVTQPIDSEGLSGKTIPSLMSSVSTNGGFLVKLLHDVFVKNREVTDHTTGVGGGEQIAAASGGSGFEGGSSFASGGDFSSMVSPASFPDYPMSSMSMASLGTFSSPSVGTGQPMDVGMAV